MANDYAAGIISLSKAIAIRNDYAKAFSNRGFLYYKLGKYKNALADLSKAINLDAHDGLAYWYRANTKRLLHLPDPCADFFESAKLDVSAGEVARRLYCK